tara:strand:+ start:977 stop:1198 length:222 start_codon:yes stop_codon:yes gene_type:complete
MNIWQLKSEQTLLISNHLRENFKQHTMYTSLESNELGQRVFTTHYDGFKAYQITELTDESFDVKWFVDINNIK